MIFSHTKPYQGNEFQLLSPKIGIFAFIWKWFEKKHIWEIST